MSLINQLNNTSPHRRVVSSPEQHAHSRDSDTFGKFRCEFSSNDKVNRLIVCIFLFVLFETDDETTPPGTPPPPYKIKTKSASDAKHPMVPKRNYYQSNSQPCSNDSVQNSHNLSEHDDFQGGDNIFNTSTTSLGSNNNISGAQANALQRQIISMEDDEVGDDADMISGESYISSN